MLTFFSSQSLLTILRNILVIGSCRRISVIFLFGSFAALLVIIINSSSTCIPSVFTYYSITHLFVCILLSRQILLLFIACPSLLSFPFLNRSLNLPVFSTGVFFLQLCCVSSITLIISSFTCCSRSFTSQINPFVVVLPHAEAVWLSPQESQP
ncbi:hypothetical protein F5050DRAFT_1286916 [Lentinula boryana]|uniref:Uncharacterized protein n=1 Tax=Lentinula boryana TaxID=40481 RepID=A0ABQ8QI14_9AGAR|nr:hypothetical protein F5050DRAFT_1286916 [Lentinula boryana]